MGNALQIDKKGVQTSEALWGVLDDVVGHWPAKLKRRWLVQFMPHWREELLERERLLRYLRIALRRGWFDMASGALRWTTWVAALTRVHRSTPQQHVSSVVALNLFNAVAALPAIEPGWIERLDEALWAQLTSSDAALDAEALTRLLGVLTPSLFNQRAISPVARVLHGLPVHERAPRWLTLPFEAAGLALVHVAEPFGSQSWEGVSELGLDEGGRLIAYSRPLRLCARIALPELGVELSRDEPRAPLQRPDVRRCQAPMLRETFALAFNAGRDILRAGLLLDGAVALLRELEGGAP